MNVDCGTNNPNNDLLAVIQGSQITEEREQRCLFLNQYQPALVLTTSSRLEWLEGNWDSPSVKEVKNVVHLSSVHWHQVMFYPQWGCYLRLECSRVKLWFIVLPQPGWDLSRSPASPNSPKTSTVLRDWWSSVEADICGSCLLTQGCGGDEKWRPD